VLASSSIEGPNANPGWLVAYAATVLATLGYFRIYRPRFIAQPLDDLRTIVAATAVAAMVITFLRVLFADEAEAAPEAVRAWLFAAVYLAAGRSAVTLIRMRMRRHGDGGDPTLIVGAGRVGRLVARRLGDRPELGLRPVAFFDHDPLDLEDGDELPVVGEGALIDADPVAFADELGRAVVRLGVSHVIVTFSLVTHEVELALVRRCEELGVSVSLVPRLFEGLPDETGLERLGGLPVVTVYPTDPRGWQFEFKYALDRAFAAVALLLLSPLLVVGVIGVRISLGRPILFRQPRVGMDEREFDMLKLRTMRPATGPTSVSLEEDLEHGLAPGGVEGEDRRTRFGAFLRRTSLDELPQLLNVLRGEMSLIGPRPERPEFAERFDRDVHRYGDRLRVKSGITGWAQVHGLRGRTSIADRVEWDNYYIENWSLWLDFKIVILTVLAVFRDQSE